MNRLTDEQAARYAAIEPLTPYAADTRSLAAEVAAYRAMRPKCPTCDGRGHVRVAVLVAPSLSGSGLRGLWTNMPPCPANCEDGFMPLADWVKLLLRTLRTARITEEWAEADAVLEMAGDQ